MPSGAGDITCIQFPRTFMNISQLNRSSHATASPVSDESTAFPISDAPTAIPVAEVDNLQAGYINIRKELYIGCWNVRTLLDVGCQSLTMRALYDYHVDIACLSEVRIPDNGSKRITVPGTDTSYWLYHSGPQDNSGQQGVAIALSSKANKALISWNPVSPRIAIARFKGSPINISVISVYAPTLLAEADVKNEFYELLQSVVNQVPRRDILVIAGDWNARTGPSDISTRHILGNFGVGQRCENGARLVNFSDFNHMCVANTRFQHPKKHLLTWYSNDGRTANQIDYLLVRSRWASSIEDCRSYRGAEAGNRGGSDHTLVRAKFKLHLKTRQKRCPSKRLNILPLGDVDQHHVLSNAISSQLSLRESDPLHYRTSSIDEHWSVLKTSTYQAALTQLGTTSRRPKDWISEHTVHLSNLARDARLVNSTDYSRLRREATRSARRDRNMYWSEIADNMEMASNVGDFGKLFRLIRNASGKHVPLVSTLRNQTGEIIDEIDGKVARWVEHFSQLLNRPSLRPDDVHVSTSATVYNVSCTPPAEEELTGVINRLKNRKSPGEDGIPAEIYKACGSVLLKPLHKLFESIWESEVFPTDWGISILLPLPKKGDKTICSNYRGISLINTSAKMFASILLNRFSAERHARTRPNQGGFRPGRGCVDQIFTLRRILEHRFKYQQPTSACFIDFRAAFDSLHRDALWNIMLSDGTPPKLVNLIKAYYSSTRGRVRVYGEESSDFDVCTGVRQGCPLSPVLFNYAIDWIMDSSLGDYRGVQLSDNTWITDVDYADDIVLLGDSSSNLAPVLDRISHYASVIGMEINTTKTKILSTFSLSSEPALTLGDSNIELASVFKYLGSCMLPNGQAKDEVRIRVDNARVAFLQLKNTLWRRTEINLKTKVRVYRASIRPVLLYGCETWPLRCEDVRKLEVFDHWCLRILSKTKWTDRVSNEVVRQRCSSISRLSVHIQQRRLQWFGHVLRKSDDELVKKVLNPIPCENWRCRLGGQLKTWLSTVKSDIEQLGFQAVYGVRHWKQNWIAICADLATDRRAWAAAIRDIHEAGSSSRRS